MGKGGDQENRTGIPHHYDDLQRKRREGTCTQKSPDLLVKGKKVPVLKTPRSQKCCEACSHEDLLSLERKISELEEDCNDLLEINKRLTSDNERLQTYVEQQVGLEHVTGEQSLLREKERLRQQMDSLVTERDDYISKLNEADKNNKFKERFIQKLQDAREKEKADYEAKICDIEAKYETCLRKEKKKMEFNKVDLMEEISKLTAKNQAYKHRLQQQRNDLSLLQMKDIADSCWSCRRCQSLQADLEHLRKENEDIIIHLNTVKRKNEMNERCVQTLNEILLEKEHDEAQIKKHMDAEERELEEVKHLKKQYDATVSELKNEIFDLRIIEKEHDQCRALRRKVDEDRMSFQQELQNQEARVQSAMDDSKVLSQEKRCLNDEVARLTNEVFKLNTHNGSLEECLSKEQMKCKDLECQLENLETVRNLNTNLQVELKTSMRIKAEFEQSLKTATDNISRQEKEIRSLLSKNAEVKARTCVHDIEIKLNENEIKLLALKTENVKLQRHCDTLTSKVTHMTQMNSRDRETIEEGSRKLEECIKELQEERSKRSDVEQKVEQLTVKLGFSEKQRGILEGQLSDAHLQMKHLKSEMKEDSFKERMIKTIKGHTTQEITTEPLQKLKESERQLHDLKDQNKRLQDKINLTRYECKQLKEENSNLIGKTKTFKSECEALHQKLKSLSDSNRKLKEELACKEHAIRNSNDAHDTKTQSLRDQVSRFESENSLMKSKLASAEMELKKYADEVAELKVQKEKLESKYETTRKESHILKVSDETYRTKLHAECKMLREELQKNALDGKTTEEEKRKLKEELDSKKSAIENIHNALARLNEENKELKQKLKNIQTENDSLQTEVLLSKSETKANLAKIEKLLDMVDELKEERESLKQDLDQFPNVNNALQKVTAENRNLHSECENLKAEIQHLVFEHKTMNEDARRMKEELEIKNRSLEFRNAVSKESQSKETEKLKQRIDTNESENHSLEAKLSRFTSQENTYTDGIVQLQETIDHLRLEKRSLQEELDHFSSISDDKEKESLENRKLRSECEELKTMLQRLSLEYKDKSKEARQLKEELESQGQTLENIILVTGRHEEENTDLKQKLRNIKAENNSLEMEVANLKSKSSADHNKIVTLEARVEQLKDEGKLLQANLEEFTKMEKVMLKVTSERDNLQQECEKMKSELQHVQLRYKSKEDTNRVKDLEIQLDDLRSTHYKEIKTANIQLEEIAMKNRSLQTEVSHLKVQVNEYAKGSSWQQSEIERLTKECQSVQNNKESIANEYEAMRKTATEKISHLQKENSDLRDAYNDALKRNEIKRAEIKKIESQNERLSSECKSLKENANRMRQTSATERDYLEKIERLTKEKDDLLHRLSRIASSKLTEGNPAIVDLSDEKRPTKLAEIYSELYDNEWTEAFDEQTDNFGRTEREAIDMLRKILQIVHQVCNSISCGYLENLRSAASHARTKGGDASLFGIGARGDAPDQLNSMLRQIRHMSAPYLQKEIKKTLDEEWRRMNFKKATRTEGYIQKCLDLCWDMSVKDPPVVLMPLPEVGSVYDKDRYRFYTESGTRVAYVVWPGMLLHDGGPILGKGVVQGMKK